MLKDFSENNNDETRQLDDSSFGHFVVNDKAVGNSGSTALPALDDVALGSKQSQQFAQRVAWRHEAPAIKPVPRLGGAWAAKLAQRRSIGSFQRRPLFGESKWRGYTGYPSWDNFPFTLPRGRKPVESPSEGLDAYTNGEYRTSSDHTSSATLQRKISTQIRERDSDQYPDQPGSHRVSPRNINKGVNRSVIRRFHHC